MPMEEREDSILVTPEVAWKWLTGQDRTLESRLRELAHLHEERLAAGAPACDLCGGTGRIADDIPCWGCKAS